MYRECIASYKYYFKWMWPGYIGFLDTVAKPWLKLIIEYYLGTCGKVLYSSWSECLSGMVASLTYVISELFKVKLHS